MKGVGGTVKLLAFRVQGYCRFLVYVHMRHGCSAPGWSFDSSKYPNLWKTPMLIDHGGIVASLRQCKLNAAIRGVLHIIMVKMKLGAFQIAR